MNIEVRVDTTSVEIKINGITHLLFSIEKFVGLQAWTDGNKFCIEYYFKGRSSILTYYDTKEKFELILNKLSEINRHNKIL